MKRTVLALALMVSAPLLPVLTAPASAQTQTDCAAQIAALLEATLNVTITGRNAEKDRAGLIGKLNAASSALDRGKTADALRKLNDYKVKIDQLSGADHISATDAAKLIQGADQVIACINAQTSG